MPSFSNQALTNPTYNASNNRMASGQSWIYYPTGNITGDPEGRMFTYDAENKQIEVLDSQQNVIGEYWYDGDGKRVKKIVPSTDEVTVFVYNVSGQLVAEYSTVISQTPKVSYTTSDHIGSPRILTDENGSVISRRDFHPFGEETFTPHRVQGLGYQPDDVRQKFTAYERDNEISLDFAQARYYSNQLGRFTTIDPLYFQMMMMIDPQRFNLYGYTRNNPLKWIDPNGERLYLRGDLEWLRSNILYEMAGGQEEFEKYFEIRDGQVILREGVDVSKANAGIQELAGLVTATENYLYFAGTDGGAAANLFEGTRDKKGNLTDKGKSISTRFKCGGNYISGCGTQIGTSGRPNSTEPAKLANGDPVFAVIAFNVNVVVTQTNTDYGTLNPVPEDVKTAQEGGVGKVVRPVSFFIHESTENRKFAEQGAGKMDYGTAHAYAIQRETAIRKALNLSGGFAGAYLDTRITKKK